MREGDDDGEEGKRERPKREGREDLDRQRQVDKMGVEGLAIQDQTTAQPV